MIRLFRKAAMTLLAGCLLGAQAGAANATTCSDLSAERFRLISDSAQLLSEYPGTSAVIGLCWATAKDEYDRTGDVNGAIMTFGICAAGGCLFAGFDNCTTASLRWAGMAIRLIEVERLEKARRCD